MATDTNKIEYVTLSKETRAGILREQLSMREAEHFRLYVATNSGDGSQPEADSRLTALTAEVKRLQTEIVALEG